LYCFDTDVVSAVLRAQPPLRLVRRLAATPIAEQCTTAITVGELVYGVEKRGDPRLSELVGEFVAGSVRVLPFDRRAAERYGSLRAVLEREGRRLGEPDLRIASIALAHDLTLVTGNVRHFRRVPELRVENWLVA
jgi:tRNA(fMet)-specific endonuclease VapC